MWKDGGRAGGHAQISQHQQVVAAGGLTRARPKVAVYPFTTTLPLAGMMPYQDILIQLVDTPPVTESTVPPGLSGTLRNSDALLLLIDAGSDDCLEQLHFCLNYLAEKKIIRNDSSSNARGIPPERLLVLLSRADQDHSGERTEILRELGPPGVKLFPVSVQTGAGLG